MQELVLFLGLKGVTYKTNDYMNSHFGKKELFERAVLSLKEYFDLRIVVSKETTTLFPLDYCRKQFSEDVASCIIDESGVVETENKDGPSYNRFFEIYNWIDEVGYSEYWIAIDYDINHWKDSPTTVKDCVVIVDEIFNEDNLQELIQKALSFYESEKMS